MLRETYPYYLAGQPVAANRALVVTNKYTGQPAARVAAADAAVRVDNLPVGGRKESANCREGVRFAMDEMSKIEHLLLNNIGQHSLVFEGWPSRT